MPRSLLDDADLAAVRTAAGPGRDPVRTALACLLHGGVLAHAPDDPAWPDRDHLVVGSEALARSVAAVAPGLPVQAGDGGGALALAAGIAIGCALDGAGSRVFCLLDDAAADDGLLWEAALSAPRGPLTALLLLEPEGAERTRRLLVAAGWRTAVAAAEDPVAVLSALDRVRDTAGGSAGAVLSVAA